MVLLTLATYIGLFLFESMPLSMIVCGIVAQVGHLFLTILVFYEPPPPLNNLRHKTLSVIYLMLGFL